MYVWIVLLIVLVLLALSIWQRIKYFRRIVAENTVIGSPLSLAIQELVAISGGIYLSLMMLVTFLKLNIPETIMILDFSFDPLAFSAISLAVIQPFILIIMNGIKKK
jgi:hypothetical protein